MEEAFNKLKKEGKADVDNLVKWMKDSKALADTKEAEQKAKELFKDVANKGNVEFAKFKEVLGQIAKDQKKTVEDLAKYLMAQAPVVGNAIAAGASAAASAGAAAFKDAVNKN